jgi:transcriptional regulator with XRE-family HTH domain
MSVPQDPRAVIEALGGREKVADDLGVGASAISNWFKDGFPKSRIPDLLQLARSAGATAVTLDVLMPMEARYPERARRAA